MNELKKICFLLLIFIALPLFADPDTSVWRKDFLLDKFGDPTDEFILSQQVQSAITVKNKTMQAVCLIIQDSTNTERIIFSFPNLGVNLPPQKKTNPMHTATLSIKNSAGTLTEYALSLHANGKSPFFNLFLENYPDFISMLSANDDYRAIIEGDTWISTFTFKGSMP
ncbi:MAG: hypothetical protein Ta2F_09980 [Termitinemataceae bacterium]|nr:MAG: hypothetical protein Ta2F_09980 [Termitinemataceae bacterium]